MRATLPAVLMAAHSAARAYHIGQPGAKWGPAEVAQWRSERVKSRSYEDDVVKALDPLRASFDVVEYGAITYDGPIAHALYAVKTKDWDGAKPSALAKAARDGEDSEPGTIPDGFYLCGDEQNPRLDFQRAVNAPASPVARIAPADPDGTIIGSPVVDDGVILYDYAALGLCGGVTNAKFTTTTEVYPDSPKATDELCNLGQVAAIKSALDSPRVNRGRWASSSASPG
ncbi:hypothetical protein SO694_000056109 [Aureococcus anophagefferens]|uniref:Peptidase S1 domain-containing protein n=1 Tax=Aureococcus anophagefferens TaxID=44056 RepID=A0ABR1G9R4_AURAN